MYKCKKIRNYFAATHIYVGHNISQQTCFPSTTHLLCFFPMKTNKKVNARIAVLPAHVQWKQTRKSVQVFKSYQLMSSENKQESQYLSPMQVFKSYQLMSNENKQESQCKYLSLTSSCPMKTRKSVQVFKSYQLMSNEYKKVSASIQVLPAHVQWIQESQCKYSSLTSSCPMKTRKSVQVFKSYQSYQLMSNEYKKVSASI